MTIALYNPASHGRPDHVKRACDILLRRLPEDRLCGIVRNIGRDGQSRRILTLAELREAEVDMFCTVFIGNSAAKTVAGQLITPEDTEMCNICVFAGTTEGRELAEFLAGQPVQATVCVATEYGETLLPEAENVTVLAGRIPVADIIRMLQETRFDLVIDATHPTPPPSPRASARPAGRRKQNICACCAVL